MADDDFHVHTFTVDGARTDMARAAAAQRIEQLLDSLTIEQLLGLREILNQDPRSWACNYYDGQVVTLLRRIHGVDPTTGETPEQALQQGANAT